MCSGSPRPLVDSDAPVNDATVSNDVADDRSAAYPVSTDGGFSHGPPTTLVRDVGMAAALSTARRDHSRILIRVGPDAAKDKGEIRLLFGWQDALRQITH